jgi:hypothetical protein
MAIKMPKKAPEGAPSEADFISGATAAPSPVRSAEHLPWLDPKVRDDLRVQLNAKIPERLMIQRDWLAHRLGMKKQDVLEIALRAWIDDQLKKLGIKDD